MLFEGFPLILVWYLTNSTYAEWCLPTPCKYIWNTLYALFAMLTWWRGMAYKQNECGHICVFSGQDWWKRKCQCSLEKRGEMEEVRTGSPLRRSRKSFSWKRTLKPLSSVLTAWKSSPKVQRNPSNGSALGWPHFRKFQAAESWNEV